jgi:hypothetical protein
VKYSDEYKAELKQLAKLLKQAAPIPTTPR